MIKLKQFDDLNLDYIKFGIFCENTEELNTLFNSLKNKRFETELVPVIFVENTFMREYIFNHFLKFKNLGFNFLLLDTYSKTKKNLIEVCSIKYLKILLENSLKAKLGLGLAGKLGLSDVSKLVELKPKIMGFRSAVCKEENRNSFLSVSKVKTLYHSIHNSRRCAIQVAGA